MLQLTGQCFCDAVKWKTNSQILWASLCHCEDCRRAASADYVSWFGVLRSDVSWQEPRKCYQSSQKVTRSFCEECGSPLSFETEILPREIHLYAVSLDKPELYQPSAHFFWSERLPRSPTYKQGRKWR